MADADKSIWIITTASLPWMTGTSVNPLLRAALLTRDREDGKVTILLPFVEVEDQKRLFPEGVTFGNAEAQAVAVRAWLVKSGLGKEAARLRLVFYPGRYHTDYCSIFPMGDVTALIPEGEADVCVLEEPEHLNWYRAPGRGWRSVAPHAVGVVHTNYLAYASGYSLWAPALTVLLRAMNKWMIRSHCHKVIKLSPVIQKLAPEMEAVCNVHGVRGDFFEVGDHHRSRLHTKGAYYIGKSVWAKGYSKLLDLMQHVQEDTGRCFDIDIYGSGPHKEEIVKTARKYGLPTRFHPGIDHAVLREYKVFVNPSESEVLCTTIAEALAMGKWVVCAKHPANQFFYQFPNCLTYRTKEEFASCVSWALHHEPADLSAELRYQLTWEAASERLFQAAVQTRGEARRAKRRLNGFCCFMHTKLSKGPTGDIFRFVCGAKEAAWQYRFMRRQARHSHPPEEPIGISEPKILQDDGSLVPQPA